MKYPFAPVCVVAVSVAMATVLLAGDAQAVQPSEVFEIWPADAAPGVTRVRGEEGLVQGRRRPFYQLTNISTATVAVFLPPEDKRTGAAVLVCPGGGMQRLAYEHEGLELADWLNSQGIAVCVLKYRVPAPSESGLMDAQRAMGLIRRRADEWQIDPHRICVMGFSAGGEIAVMLATRHSERAYKRIDEADDVTCRPTNVCLVYPGGIVRQGSLRQDIAEGLDEQATPPMFIVHAFPDASENSLALAQALKRSRVPCEMHLYQQGGHGFGARETPLPLNSWKARFLEWLTAFGFFDKPHVGAYARSFLNAVRAEGTLPRFADVYPNVSLAEGYAAQKHFVTARLADDHLVGFKGGASSTAAQTAMKIDAPIHGVLFQSGRIAARDGAVIDTSGSPDAVIETELGFVISSGLDISYRLTSIDQAKGAVDAIVPVIEMPNNYARRMGAPLTAPDAVATNLGSASFIVGVQRTNPDAIDPNEVTITLKKDGATLHQTTGGFVRDGQWANLMTLINQVVDQGYTLRAGDLVICGSLGEVHPVEVGRYEADFGPLGTIQFELK